MARSRTDSAQAARRCSRRSVGVTTNAAARRDVHGCVVFSRDRPMQLHALLSWYFEKAKNPARVHVLYRASSARFEAAYREALALFEDQALSVTRETSFRDDLL